LFWSLCEPQNETQNKMGSAMLPQAKKRLKRPRNSVNERRIGEQMSK
jgi:hypothetical protein